MSEADFTALKVKGIGRCIHSGQYGARSMLMTGQELCVHNQALCKKDIRADCVHNEYSEAKRGT